MGFFGKMKERAAKATEIRRPEAGTFGEFVPENELESTLLQVVEGKAELNGFLEQLLRSKIFMLFNGNLAEAKDASAIRPLAMTNASGAREVAIFTSPTRATPLTRQAPEYEYGMLVETGWALKGVAPGIGVVINPGWRAGLEMPAEGLARFKEHYTIQ